jgi:hypothetical protein
MAGNPTARIGDHCTHGATLITGSGTVTTDGIPTVRIGDLVSCPQEGHGINPRFLAEMCDDALGVTADAHTIALNNDSANLSDFVAQESALTAASQQITAALNKLIPSS